MLSKLTVFFSSTTKALAYLYQTGAPMSVLFCYLLTILERIHSHKLQQRVLQFEMDIKDLKLTHRWFRLHVPFWLLLFEKFGLQQKPITALEIGSWEGLSSWFILRTLPNCRLTSVDTWEGSDEHAQKEIVSNTEHHFDANTAPYQNLLTKYKGTSYQFFAQSPTQELFDFIYIDGSHHADDVMVDAVCGFTRLKNGGIMVFDDYLWQFYPNKNDNPAAAIHAFLRLKKGQYRLLHAYSQLMIIKTACVS